MADGSQAIARGQLPQPHGGIIGCRQKVLLWKDNNGTDGAGVPEESPVLFKVIAPQKDGRIGGSGEEARWNEWRRRWHDRHSVHRRVVAREQADPGAPRFLHQRKQWPHHRRVILKNNLDLFVGVLGR